MAPVSLVQITPPDVYFGTETAAAGVGDHEAIPTVPSTVRLAAKPATDRVDRYGRLRQVIRARNALNVNIYLVKVRT